MNNTDSICPADLNITKYFKIPVYCVVMLTGLPLNALALWVLHRQLKKSAILSIYITNLVLANLLQTLTLPFWIYYSYHNHSWGLGKGVCLVVGFAFRTNFYAKNNFLCLVAMERYFGLVHPLTFYRLQTIQGATGMSIACWLLVATLCAVGIGLEAQNPRAWQEEYCLDSCQLNYKYALFKMIVMGPAFFIPCFLMGFFYFRVLFELRKVASLEKKVKKQIYWFVSLIIVTFFFFFTPYQVTSFYRYYWEVRLADNKIRNCNLVVSTFLYENTTLCLTTLDNIFAPLLYILLLKDIRAEFKYTFNFRGHRHGTLHEPQVQIIPSCLTVRQVERRVGSEEETANSSHTAG
uniref:G-protein coupled receptors family 1 profile domain-containing protein n=1 Tax=Salvator merianae TaxID=96440 RepID=A0A8D0BCN3_SALMN